MINYQPKNRIYGKNPKGFVNKNKVEEFKNV